MKFLPLSQAILLLLWTLTAVASQAAPPAAPANTAAAAMQAVTDFLPAEATAAAVPLITLELSQPLWDLLPAYAGIHQAYQDSLAGLTAGTPSRYTAALTADYRQEASGGKTIDKAETEKRLWNLVQRNHCTEALFGIVSLQLIAPDHAIATVMQHLECLSLNTPPTEVKDDKGQVFLVNNTGRMEVTQTVQQEWVRQGDVWRLSHARTLQVKMGAVL